MTSDAQRTEIHHRQIDLRFYRRVDGLYEVEGKLLDRKAHPFRRVLQDHDTPAGTALHDITVRLVIDEQLLVHDVSATLVVTPFGVCSGAAGTLEPLKGQRLGAGWNRRVRELLGGAACCTHIVELLGPMATTAHQGLAPQRLARLNSSDTQPQNPKVDSCYAYAAEREVVATLWPHLARRPGPEST
jgi:hypothetical protein